MSATVSVPMNDQRKFYLVLSGLVLAAWGLLFAWQRSPYAGLLSHKVIDDHGLPPQVRVAAFLSGWLLMTVGMMLPGSLPLLNRVAGNWRAGLTLLGYLASWVLFGLLVYLGDNLLHRLAEPGAPLAALSGWIPAAIVLIAGTYQLTPAKRRFLARCRPAPALFSEGCREPVGGAGSLGQGFSLGVSCVASCWSLMLLVSALGHQGLGWMLVLGGIMAAERLTPWGQRLAWVVGFALIVWVAFWVLASLLGGHSQPLISP